MDLERIKQNFRLRSGRSKKPPKKSKASTPADVTKPTQKDNTQSSTSHQANGSTATPSALDTSASKLNLQPDLQVTNGQKKEDAQAKDIEKEALSLEPEHRQASPQFENNHTIESNDQEDQRSQEDREEMGIASPGRDVREQSSRQDSTTPIPTKDVSNKHAAPMDGDSEPDDFDLRPPAPRPQPPSVETMAELLFSAGHLNTTIYTPALLARFTAFLQKYKSQDYPLLLRYLETSKAISAVEYANAVAEAAPALPQTVEGNEMETSDVAATINGSFKEACSSAFDTLLNTSMPLYITYNLVRTVSECLIDEITGRSTPYMRDMVGGLSEVFCLTDPNQEDNPIIYASEEFYRLTGYGPNYVIGHNCRFLQGQKTARASPKRIRESLDRGEETYETLLNYRRDGRPFINVLMIAPLHDDRGNVKYHIGAQVDVSRLVESGRVLDGFQTYLMKRESDTKREAKEKARSGNAEDSKRKKALKKLRELSELFDLEESTIVQSNSRSTSVDRDDDVRSIGSVNARRRFVDSDASEDEYEKGSVNDQQEWKLGQSGPSGLSGKLPGVYEKYMLIRAAPSLRIVFVSSKLQKFGRVVQSPFMSHVAAPAGTLSGLAESFKDGIPVSAKINFMPQRTERRNGTSIPPSERHEDGKYGSACWISATPLLGGDDRVGVWMIIFVEKAQAKAQRARSKQQPISNLRDQRSEAPSQRDNTDRFSEQRIPGPPGTNQKKGENSEHPIKPRRLDAPINFAVKRQESHQSATAYQYRAASPVEEYHSADDIENSSPPVTPAPRAIMPPQTPTYEITDEADYVQPKSGEFITPSSNRLLISPDDDSEGEDDNAPSSDRLGSSPEPSDLATEPEDPNHIPPSIPSDHEALSDGNKSDTQKTPPESRENSEKNQNFGVYSTETIRRQHTPPPSSPRKSSSPDDRPSQSQATPASTRSQHTPNSRHSVNLPAGLGYMDYLRYPGSGRKPPKGEDKRGRRKARHGSDSDPWSETDCAKSPYSVD